MPEVYGKPVEKFDPFEHVRKLSKTGKFGNPWGSFVVADRDVHYETQQDDEYVMIFGRRHIITNIWWMAIVWFALFVPFVWDSFPFISELSNGTHFALIMLWYLFVFFFAIENLLMWFFNVYLITNERVIDVDFFGLLYKNINATHISKIEDVNYSQKGIMASFFDFGDVVVQTASAQRSDEVFVKGGESSPFTFEAIAHPNMVIRIVSELMEWYDKRGMGR
jgi:hypothetical protein